MKKIIALMIISANLLTVTANAAWEFNEKILGEAYGASLNYETKNYYEYISIYEYYQGNGSREDPSYGYDVRHFDLNGNNITYSDTIKPSTDTKITAIKTPEPKSEEEAYFTNNHQSLLITNGSSMQLVDLNGNILAEDFLVGEDWDRTDVARKVLNWDKVVGIMAYDGRMIVPMVYRDVELYQNNLYIAKGVDEQNIYNYNGEIVFTLPNNYKVTEMGVENWMVVSRRVEDKHYREYALLDFNGNPVIDFGDYTIDIFDASQDWKTGEFVQIKLINSADEKYINRRLEEIDLFSLDSVYCKEYEEFSDTVIIFNHYMDKDYKYQTKYALYDKVNKKYIIPYQQQRLEKNGEYLLQYNKAFDQYGNFLFEIEGNELLNGFKDGIAEIGISNETNVCNAFCDQNGKNIFGRNYDHAIRIDNNQFLVQDGRTIKILTAKGIIGEALNTDVKISINGYEIPCYSAYGYAVIKAEDLRYFGFDVEWNGEERMLYISRNPEYCDITAGDFGESGETGTHYADIYGSDINVEYNGKRLSSYCINGVTLIKPEDLVAEGITFNYDDSQRTLFMNVEGLEQK